VDVQTSDQGWEELQAHIERFFDQVLRVEKEKVIFSRNMSRLDEKIRSHSAEYLVIESGHPDGDIAIFYLDELGIVNRLYMARVAAAASEYLFSGNGLDRTAPPKIIFLDFHIPQISGLELLRKIKANEQAKEIPIVMLISSISTSEVNECKRLGVNKFLAKPLAYEEFLNLIKRFDR